MPATNYGEPNRTKSGLFGIFKRSFKRGARKDRRYLDRVFSKSGARKADEALTSVIGKGRRMTGVKRWPLFAWAGSVAFGASRRMQEGDSMGAALVKEGIRDAAYLAMPYLIPLTAARGLARMYPELNAMAEAEVQAQASYRTLGGGYQSTEADHASRARAMEMIERTRMAQPGGEARRYHRTP